MDLLVHQALEVMQLMVVQVAAADFLAPLVLVQQIKATQVEQVEAVAVEAAELVALAEFRLLVLVALVTVVVQLLYQLQVHLLATQEEEQAAPKMLLVLLA
jgi:hypothetical protein